MKKGIFLSILALIMVAIAWLYFYFNKTQDSFPIHAYYKYDAKLPLQDSILNRIDSTNFIIEKLAFNSVSNERVPAYLSLPKNVKKPPVIILLHGLGDSKNVDYIQAGHQQFLDNDYAVFRIDVANHGERKQFDYPFDLLEDYKYWTRAQVTQTVFDLRRAVDYLETRKDINRDKIAYYGISLGGIIGTIFCGVEKRVKVPVIVIAGGNLNLMYEKEMLSKEVLDYLSIIEPSNFVATISPRPLLMINAEKDEVIPPIMSKLLFQKAKEPKHIVWFPTKHKEVPIFESYDTGIQWITKHLNK